ncbi:MAG: hypothetical protein U0795_07050 [Pirellulales bacterium]
MYLTIEALTQLVCGRLKLAAMPPLGGAWEPVGKVTEQLAEVETGDVYIVPVSPDGMLSAYEAFARGALGVMTDHEGLVPWPGTCVVEVDDLPDGLARLASWQADEGPTVSQRRNRNYTGTSYSSAGPSAWCWPTIDPTTLGSS